MESLKKYKGKLVAMGTLGAMSLFTCASAFAATSTPTADYSAITTEITAQATGIVDAAKPMILGILGIGIVISGVFILFKLGKKGIGTATGSKG